MRRAPKRFGLSLDSFLDILTNVVGVLVLIAMVIVVNAGGLSVSLGTPMVHSPAEDCQRILLEIRGNRLVHVDEKQLYGLFEDHTRRHFNKDFKALDADEFEALPTLFEQHDVGNEFYCVRPHIEERLSFIEDGVRSVKFLTFTFEPRNRSQGESLAEIRRPGSDYESLIEKLDSTRHYLYFFVQPDSFETFRAARQIARSRGFSTGWEPRGPGEPLCFGPEGADTFPQER
jgi:hypothetical protein